MYFTFICFVICTNTRFKKCSTILVNCWPNVTSSGCDVNIEYELQADELELDDVVISVPLP